MRLLAQNQLLVCFFRFLDLKSCVGCKVFGGWAFEYGALFLLHFLRTVTLQISFLPKSPQRPRYEIQPEQASIPTHLPAIALKVSVRSAEGFLQLTISREWG